MEASDSATDMMHTLLFTVMVWSALDIQLAKVFFLSNRILGGQAKLYSPTVAQATIDFPAIEDPDETAKRQTRLSREANASFDAHTSDDRGPTMSYDSSESTGAAYLSNVAARLSCALES